MRYFSAILIFACGLVPCWQAAADTPCNCTIYPFEPDPPCRKRCTAAILHTASRDSLQALLGISQKAAQQIIAARSSGARSLEDFKTSLPPKDRAQLDAGLGHLSTEKLMAVPELHELKSRTKSESIEKVPEPSPDKSGKWTDPTAQP